MINTPLDRLNFCGVHLIASFVERKVAIDWVRPETLSVDIALADDPSGAILHREWAPEPKAAREAQAQLVSIPLSAAFAVPGENSISLLNSGKRWEASWEPGSDDEALKVVRNVMFQAARVTYLESLAYLWRGHVKLVAGNYQKAMTAFRQGISVLGSSYRAPHVLDDTDVNISCSGFELRDGRMNTAANLLEGALECRTMQYADREGLPLERVREPIERPRRGI